MGYRISRDSQIEIMDLFPLNLIHIPNSRLDAYLEYTIIEEFDNLEEYMSEHIEYFI